MKIFISIFVIFLSWSFVNAQSCRPAELNYIVRDERGNVLSESMLHKVFRDVKPPTSGIGTVAFTEDGKLVGYSGKDPAKTLPAIFFVNAASCQITVGEVALTRGKETMRLVFNLDINRRAYTIDSLPFRRGTFRLDQKGLSDIDQKELVPASRWKKAKR